MNAYEEGSTLHVDAPLFRRLDFMNPDVSFPVNHRLVELEHDCGPYRKGAVWAEPDTDPQNKDGHTIWVAIADVALPLFLPLARRAARADVACSASPNSVA